MSSHIDDSPDMNDLLLLETALKTHEPHELDVHICSNYYLLLGEPAPRGEYRISTPLVDAPAHYKT
jgi:hypothetical protein